MNDICITIQNKVEKIISNYPLEDDISIIIMKPYSGKVISLIGGKNYKESKFNRALDAYKQIGSTIKPLLYYTALLKGMSTLSTFTSKKTSFIMPDNDITIIARFTVQNPNTGDISIIVLFSILTITSVILIKRKKEAK